MGNTESQIEDAFVEFVNTTKHDADYLSFSSGWYAAIKALPTRTLTDYLRERHPTVNSLTAAEAKLLGIGYPLHTGWVDRFGDMPINDRLLAALRTARARRIVEQKIHKARRAAK